MRGLLIRVAVAGVFCGVVTSVFAEQIEVPCEEHKLLTGQDLCDSLPTLK